MPNIAINFGRILILVGIIGYAAAWANGSPSPTALIPAAFGAILMILGYAARAKESLRKHLMHVAVLIGLLGFLMPAIRLISKFSELTFTTAVIAQIVMSLVCLIFVLLSVKSFMDARKAD